MRRFALLLASCLAVGLLSGCTRLGGYLNQSTTTETNLTKKNYRIMKTNVRGVSSGFSILFLPIVPPSYADAMTNLHENVQMEGKATALVNVAVDANDLNLLLFALPRITITADVVEFTE